MRQPQITDKHQQTNIKFLIIFLTNKIVPFCYLSMLIFWAIWRCLYGSFELSLEIRRDLLEWTGRLSEVRSLINTYREWDTQVLTTLADLAASVFERFPKVKKKQKVCASKRKSHESQASKRNNQNQVVVSNTFLFFYHYLWKWSNLTTIFSIVLVQPPTSKSISFKVSEISTGPLVKLSRFAKASSTVAASFLTRSWGNSSCQQGASRRFWR